MVQQQVVDCGSFGVLTPAYPVNDHQPRRYYVRVNGKVSSGLLDLLVERVRSGEHTHILSVGKSQAAGHFYVEMSSKEDPKVIITSFLADVQKRALHPARLHSQHSAPVAFAGTAVHAGNPTWDRED